MAGKEEEFGVSAVALESLERNFIEVMKELSAEDNLERFKLEYEKLHRALKKSHESEKRLIKKCKELNQEIMATAAKVQEAMQLAQDDQTTITSIRKEIEKAWKMVDGAHEKEARSKDTIQQLKKEIARLTALVEKGAGLTIGQESNLQELIEEKKKLTKERETSSQRYNQMAHELKDWIERVKKVQVELEKAEEELRIKVELKKELDEEYKVETQKKEHSETKVREYQSRIGLRGKENEELRDKAKQLNEELEKVDKKLKQEREDVHNLTSSHDKLQRDLQTQTEQLAQTDTTNTQLQKHEIPKRNQELQKKIVERDNLQKAVEKNKSTVSSHNHHLKTLEEERDSEAGKIKGLEKEINELVKEIEKMKEEIYDNEQAEKNVVRAKNLVISETVKEESERVRLEGELIIQEGKNRSLEQETASHRRANEKQREEINLLEQQQQTYYSQAQEATGKYAQALEEVKLGKERIAQFQIALEEAEKKLKNQQSMYESVRSDRALYKKNLNEANEQIHAMKRDFRLMDHKIDQLKEELSQKEKELCIAHAAQKNLSKSIDSATRAAENNEKNYKNVKTECDNLGDEIKQLTQIIADCDTEKAKQQMKFNSVTNERNILATQLIRRNDELALLYEKIRIQQSTLGKGEAQYKERLADIKILRNIIAEQRSALRISLARIRNVEEMKRHITTLQRQLMHERTKVKALYEELQNPMNVHRWRKLEGSDPQEMENILKVKTLQKRLIRKTEECTAKERIIQAKEQQYVELKNILSRQPGPEIAEQLNVYHENIVKRAAQMQRMSNELDTSTVQVNEYKYDVDRLSAELLDVKKKYFTLKSKNQTMIREKQLASGGYSTEEGQAFVIHHPPNQPRFAGGGFSLSQ